MLRRVQHVYVDWQQFILRWFFVGTAIVLIFVLGFLMFSPVVRVRAIHVKRSDTRLDIEQVQHALAPLFGKHTLFLSQLEVLSLLRGVIPDLRKVRLEKQYPADIVVSVELDPIVARTEIVEPAAGEDTAPVPEGTGALLPYLTDKGMLIETDAPQGADLPVIYLVDWGARPQSGSAVLPPEFFMGLRDAEKEIFSQFGYRVTERTVFLRGQEFHLRVERDLPEGGARSVVLWFDTRSTLAEHLQRYRTFLQALGPDAAQEYIDLRLKDRIVYK